MIYYQDNHITIFHGDCRDILPSLKGSVMVTDPPYGISYKSSKTGQNGGISLPGIIGDSDSSLRDSVLELWNGPALVFGSWKVTRPQKCKMILIWEKGDHVGMGDLSLPWKPNTEEIYVLGTGFSGHRGTSVLRYSAPVSWNSTTNGRSHPHQKPIGLMTELINKCPEGVIIDPFCGVGPTLRAAKNMNRKAVGIEIEEQNCEIAARWMAQEILF